MRIFYGLYVQNEKLAAAFDLIRFLAEPNFFRRAHITVRGPYTTPLTINSSETFTIYPKGIDSFFDVTQRQHTVFLKCEIPGIERVWHKPDFEGKITPHITFYDGKERSLAYSLLRQLQTHNWIFPIQSTELVEVAPKAAAASLNEFQLHQETYNEILGQNIDYRIVGQLHWRKRIDLVAWVADFVDKNFAQVK
ncbi:MAG: hypothetical protein EKK40_06390 [Bradyrhizobiaceae bacterium]|nr:MAG: hypothetical protein EKK40_06390 [Bradyrhizobiaceae bacterium]